MPANKNQHFVPKCYLKAFTLDRKGHAINVYNLSRDLAIKMAPVKNQCSGEYFYGSDLTVEKALQHLEGEYSQTLRALQQPGYKLTKLHCQILRSFWLLQYMRTEAASQREVELAAEVDEFIGSDAHKIGTSIAGAVQAAMHRFSGAQLSVSDLKVCLFRNKTTVPFVTSDDPAVLANRWYAIDGRVAGVAHGLSSAGALCFLPLTPQLLCLAYDGDVYNISHTNGWVDVHNCCDVHALNQHQYLNCRANIYFHLWEERDARKHESAELLSLRPETRHRLNFAVLESVEGKTKTFRKVDREIARASPHVLMHMEAFRPHPPSWPRQITFRTGGRAFRGGTGRSYVRSLQRQILGDVAYHKARTF